VREAANLMLTETKKFIAIGFDEHHHRRVGVETTIFRYILGTIQKVSNE